MRAAGVLEAVDLHVGGAPVRLVQSGYPDLGGGTVAARARRAARSLDGLRRRLLLEPWGATGLEGAVLVPPGPGRHRADAGLLLLGADGYPQRSGRTALAAASWLWRTGRAGAARPWGGGSGATVVLDSPAGPLPVAVDAGPEEASPVARLANPPAVEVAVVAAAGVRLVRVGGRLVAVTIAPEGAAGIEASALAAARARLGALRSAVEEAATRPLDEWLLAAPPSGTGPWAVAGFDGRDRLERAPTFEGLGALALHLAAEGRAAEGTAVAVRGLADAAVTVRLGAGSGDVGFESEVEARAFVIAVRRFALDPADEVAPFLVP